MPEPQFLRRITMNRVPTLPELLDFGDMMACNLQDKQGQAPFLWLFQCGPTLDVMLGRWDNDEEKDITLQAIRASLEQSPKITAYVSIFEMWVASYDKSERRATARVENDPRRQSALMVTAFARSGGHCEKIYTVSYDDKGKPSRTLNPEMQGRFSGRMFDLFRPQVPLPPDHPKVADA